MGIEDSPKRLKSWESPSQQGRNIKGKGGSARKKQLEKRLKRLLSNFNGNRG